MKNKKFDLSFIELRLNYIKNNPKKWREDELY